jgi:N-acetylmuramoyl-L-alanine amidase
MRKWTWPETVLLAVALLLAPNPVVAAAVRQVPEGVIVLDPGHGGADPGVVSPSGMTEKEATLALALRLREKLEANLGLKVILTRSGDLELSHRERSEMANTNKALLFVSLHLGGSASQSVDTVTVFFADAWPPREGDKSPGAWIRWDEQNRPHRDRSKLLALALDGALSTFVSREPRGAVGANLALLTDIGAPAVLVEPGCLTSPDRARLLGEDGFLNALAGVLAKGIAAFLEGDGT